MAWTGTPKSVTKSDDGTNLIVTIEVTDGSYTETLVRPMFRPSSMADFNKTSKNWISEVKLRKMAKDAVDLLYPEIQKELNKPIPEAVQIGE